MKKKVVLGAGIDDDAFGFFLWRMLANTNQRAAF